MKPIISDLVTRYEEGKLSRRDLIQGLAMVAAASAAASAAAGAAGAAGAQTPAAPEVLTATGIDHVSVRVKDLARSAAFYQSLFGLAPLGEDKDHNILRLGRKRVIVSLRQDMPHGQIDHFGIAVENFNKDAATRFLTQRGFTPKEDWEYGYHIKDPDGAVVQML